MASYQLHRLDFNGSVAGSSRQIELARDNWPCVYVLADHETGKAYVGETHRLTQRLLTHLKGPKAGELSKAHIVTSKYFNKSAALQMESEFINLMLADQKFDLLNANGGQESHPYFERNRRYERLIEEAWDGLRGSGLAVRARRELLNSDLFKLSPFKTLTARQEHAIHQIMSHLITGESITVEGGAGTGKSVLLVFLCKLLMTDITDLDSSNLLHQRVKEWRVKHSEPKLAVVIAMTSFRASLKAIFKAVPGLSSSMVIGPTQLRNSDYDLVLVDEAHRLRRRRSLTGYGAFDNAARQLGLDPHETDELEWVQARSQQHLLFYDAGQSVRPSDITTDTFGQRTTSNTRIKLSEQLRSKGGNALISHIASLFDTTIPHKEFESDDFEFVLFNSYPAMVERIECLESAEGLSRLVAGFAWPWISNQPGNEGQPDIIIDGLERPWNREAKRWVESEGSVGEIGCIHTIQGYDLNYVGVIVGLDLKYDKASNRIVCVPDQHFDKKGKQGLSTDELLQYILNIYRTMLLRGIKGTFVYVCDEDLRAFLSHRIPVADPAFRPIEILTSKPIDSPSLAVYDLRAAAGGFGDEASSALLGYVRTDRNQPDRFVCQIHGDSMNRIAGHGDFAIFKKDPGGSRQGKAVLVEWRGENPEEPGAHYSFKEYHRPNDNSQQVHLLPRSNDPSYKPIILTPDTSGEFAVVGIFDRVLSDD